jgi:glyoxylase-like metal-dependent hydrolase (beta-lactamase superfamily II)
MSTLGWTLDRRSLLKAGAALGLGAGMPRAAGAQGAAFAPATLLDGCFPLPPAALARGREPAEVAGVLQAAGLPTDRAETVLNVTLLRAPGRVVLVDVGAGPNFVPGTGKLGTALEASGVKPEDITDVLFTHGHPDHLWGALDDFDTPAFANARWFFPAAERDYWFAPGTLAELPEDRKAFAAGATRILGKLEPVVKLFRPGVEPVPGIVALAAPGHTPGHVAFRATTAEGPLLVVGDAITHAAISFARPDWAGSFDRDAETAARTRRALLGQAVSERARIVGYHLPNGGMGRVEIAGAGWRFVQA